MSTDTSTASPVDPRTTTEATPPPGLSLAIRVSGAALVGSTALVFAVIESFLVPLRFNEVYVPVSAAMALIVNAGLTFLAVWLTGWRITALLPGVVWFAVVVGLSRPTGDGDLVIPDVWPGYAMLLTGAAAAVVAAYVVVTRRR
ncbi:hypothetical protein AB0I28_34195 [Phytomonospora sp. NPDC050363]|uniref:hypothetical protein n=1 Tax=Phytomonospora sp. NPDC050363 TaxID=3155642 RepID=UPI00341064C9